MPIESMDKENKKRQEAMKKRLQALGIGNPVVKQAIEENEPKRDVYKEFAVIDELVNAARNKYRVDGDFKTCVRHLAEALGKLAEGKSTGGIDSKTNEVQNKETEADY